MAFVTDSNRPQPLGQPPPTACPTAAGAASEAPSLVMHPCPPPPPSINGPCGAHLPDCPFASAPSREPQAQTPPAPTLKGTLRPLRHSALRWSGLPRSMSQWSVATDPPPPTDHCPCLRDVGSDVLERPYTAGGGGAPPPLDPPPPPPLPMFEAGSQSFASAPSVPRGFTLQNFWPAFGGDHRGTLGGGGVPTKPPSPPPPSDPPSHPLLIHPSMWV